MGAETGVAAGLRVLGIIIRGVAFGGYRYAACQCPSRNESAEH